MVLTTSLFLSCGTEDSLPTSNHTIIQIIDQSFLPDEIEARAGETIFFQNFDATPHQILSESAPDLFDDTNTFSSGFIDLDEVGLITVPSTALPGDVFYFYSDVLEAAMATPNGVITIVN